MPGRQLVQKAKEKMFGISTQLMEDSKDLIKAGGPEINTSRDLLSILLKANLGIDVPEDQRLSDADVVSRKLNYFPRRFLNTSLQRFRRLSLLATKRRGKTP
jgi:hypothetical protein